MNEKRKKSNKVTIYCPRCGNLNKPKDNHTEKCRQYRYEYYLANKKKIKKQIRENIWTNYVKTNNPYLNYFLRESRKKFAKVVVCHAKYHYRQWLKDNPGKDFLEEKLKENKQKKMLADRIRTRRRYLQKKQNKWQ